MGESPDLKGWSPARIVYEPFDPARHGKLAEELEDRIAHLEAFHGMDEQCNVQATSFTAFTFLLQRGRPRVTYSSYAVQAPDGSRYMFWLTNRHAELIGRALVPTLKTFRLEITRLEDDGFTVMAGAARDGLALEELIVPHCSGDEVSVVAARGLARLATKLRAGTLRLWAREFDPGSLDALADELARLGNETLETVDVCDTSKEEPHDAVDHPALAALAARNRGGKR